MKTRQYAFIGFCVGIFSTSMVYLGVSNHRLADTHDALSADINLIVEIMTSQGVRYPTGQLY